MVLVSAPADRYPMRDIVVHIVKCKICEGKVKELEYKTGNINKV